MAKYLVDVNLPYLFSVWRSQEYLHVRDIDDEWSDSEVWRYSEREDLTIITKDADFSARSIVQPPPPRVIHIRLGNLKMRELHRALSLVWPDVCALSRRCRLVQVFPDRIEGIE